MGAGHSDLTKDEISSIAAQYKCAPKKIKVVWNEYQAALHQLQDGMSPLKQRMMANAPRKYTSSRGQHDSLDFDAFRKFCELYFNIDTTAESSIRHLFQSFDRDGDGTVSFEEVMVSAMVLDQGTPEEKLEFLFQAYCKDTTTGLNIDTQLEPICDQMVATNMAMGRNVEGLKPTLMAMLRELDRSGTGFICQDEWIYGGVTIMPLLVLLGVDQSTYNIQKRPEGQHMWRLSRRRSSLSTSARKFYCAVCISTIKAESLLCNSCGAKVHMECAVAKNTVCRVTCSVDGTEQHPNHFWVAGGYKEDKCMACLEKTKETSPSYRCAWCKRCLHDICKKRTDGLSSEDECNLGEFRSLIIPYTSFRFKPVEDHSPQHDMKRLNLEATNKFDSVTATSYQDLANPMRILNVPDSTPLLVLINPGSGAQQGPGIIDQLSYILNPRQVFDITVTGGPCSPLRQFQHVHNLRLLVAGGDGTVGWVMSELDQFGWHGDYPPIAILPLGTGNDLARCYGWGPGYTGGSLTTIARKLMSSTMSVLDRWSITVERLEHHSDDSMTEGDPIPLSIINNYFSIGIDASIAHKFHIMRQQNPGKFKSRSRNKIIYAELGASEMMSRRCTNMHKHMTMEVDGVSIDLQNGPAVQTLAMLNILTIYAGRDVWGPKATKSFSAQRMDDKIFEIAGITDMKHMGTITAGIGRRGNRIAQGSECIIRTTKTLPMQIDGEPWLQSPCQITIKHHNQARILRPDKPVEADRINRNSISNLLE